MRWLVKPILRKISQPRRREEEDSRELGVNTEPKEDRERIRQAAPIIDLVAARRAV